VLARQLHPDKRRVSADQATYMFQVLTDAYKTLLDRLEGRRPDRGFHDMRDDHRRYREQEQRGGGAPPRDGEDFDTKRFNAVFDKHRISDPVVDGGYGRWMEKNDPDDPATRRRAMAVISKARGNEPEPVSLNSKACVAFSELGASGVTDYSRTDAASGRRTILYSDYRLAHTTESLAQESEFEAVAARARNELSSIDALEKHRSSISYTMSSADARAEEARAAAREAAERRRLDALSAYDRMVETVHAKTTRLLGR
jgi:curved DNA-binding protein CbpA